MKSILLVDDDPQLLPVLERALQRRGDGWEVVSATGGREALELARARPFDLVVTDIFMPDRDGLETMGAIRRLHPTTRILAMTGGGAYVGTEFLRVAEVLGAHAVLTKPFGLTAFVETIRGLLADAGPSDGLSAPSTRAADGDDRAPRRRPQR